MWRRRRAARRRPTRMRRPIRRRPVGEIHSAGVGTRWAFEGARRIGAPRTNSARSGGAAREGLRPMSWGDQPRVCRIVALFKRRDLARPLLFSRAMRAKTRGFMHLIYVTIALPFSFEE